MAKRYQKIVDYIKEKIDSTAWPVGYKLPREVDLCTEFDVSRTTIRRALSVLVADGHLQRLSMYWQPRQGISAYCLAVFQTAQDHREHIHFY